MLRKITIGLGLALASGLAAAHHAGTMYDHERVETISGEVKEWRWANPHAFLQIVVPDKNGTPVVWSFETTSPNLLVKAGWRRNSVVPGEKVTVSYNPLRDGAPGGSLAGVTLPDGKKLSIGPPGPSGGAPAAPAADSSK